LGWLIDTSLWVAVERGALSAADIHALTRQEPVYLSPINVAELQFGVEMLRPGPRRQRAMSMLRRLRRKPLLRITHETGEMFGRLGADIRKAGRDTDVRINDLWLAAQALQRDFGLLTSNPRDFADIPGLRMVALRVP
jgi:predicted nucleic acid-binding protein